MKDTRAGFKNQSATVKFVDIHRQATGIVTNIEVTTDTLVSFGKNAGFDLVNLRFVKKAP